MFFLNLKNFILALLHAYTHEYKINDFVLDFYFIFIEKQTWRCEQNDIIINKQIRYPLCSKFFQIF